MLQQSLTTRVDARKFNRLTPEMEARKWKPGQTGNPGGRSDDFFKAQQLCRKASPAAAQTLVDMLDDPDGRLRGYAADKIREWAWGKIPDYDPSKEDQRQGSFDPSRLSADQLALVKAALLVLVQAAVVPANETVVENSAPVDGMTDGTDGTDAQKP